MQNRNLITFVALALLLFLGWDFAMQKLYPRKPLPKVAAGAAKVPEASNGPASAVIAHDAKGSEVKGSLKASLTEEHTVSVETQAYHVELSSRGGRVRSLVLKGFTQKSKGKEEALDLIPSIESPLFGAVELQGVDLLHADWLLETAQPLTEAEGWQSVRFSSGVPLTVLKLRKTYSFHPQKPEFKVRVEVLNPGKESLKLQGLSFLWGPNLGGVEASGMGQFPPAGVVQLEAKIEREKAGNSIETFQYSAPRWVALKNHYFVTGIFPVPGSAWDNASIRNLAKGQTAVSLGASSLEVGPGQTVSLEASLYAGPQEYEELKNFGKNFQQVIQFQFYRLFDWLNPLCVGLLHILKWFHAVTGNWGVAIILLTLLVRGFLFYPSHKSMVSMRKMQSKMAAMQPRLDTLKKMYKDDAGKLNSESMKLYKEYGVNPLGGCLPMLLQIPIFFALYGTLQAAFELRQAHFFWKWTDLTAGDPTFIFPLLMGASMFLQQKLAPASATMSEDQAQMQKMMMYIMPIMFTGMSVFMAWPVGLLLYWTASNLFGITQQLVVNKTVS